MNQLWSIDWERMFVPSLSLLEIFLRGSMMYLALLVILRVVLKRQAGTVGLSDLLVVVLMADAAQNGMAGDYVSITEGVVLVATIIFWSYLFDWLDFRFPRLQRWLRPPPLPLVRDGHILYQNLRKELITEDELLSMLRQEGVDQIGEVKRAFMEGDGRISVVKHNGQ